MERQGEWPGVVVNSQAGDIPVSLDGARLLLLPFQRTNTTTNSHCRPIGCPSSADPVLDSDWPWLDSVELLSTKSPYLLAPAAALNTSQKLQEEL